MIRRKTRKLLLDEKTASLNHHGHCPECNANWDGGDIFPVLREQNWCKDKSDDDLLAYIRQFYAPPYKFSRIIGVELPYDHPDHYDGVSYWQCPDCAHKFQRFATGVSSA